jgi:hypothetical protein
MTFEYGFEYKGAKYGFKKKKLYRLPYFKEGRNYGFLEIPQTKIGKTKVYRIQRDKLTLNRIQNITTKVNWEIDRVEKNKHCPF